MTTINDAILAATGGPTVSDGLLAHYQAGGATSNNVIDAERQFLIAAGATDGQLNDMWFEQLGAAGYTGALDDRRLEFWKAGGNFEGGFAPRPGDNVGVRSLTSTCVGTLSPGIRYDTVDDGATVTMHIGWRHHGTLTNAIFGRGDGNGGFFSNGSAASNTNSISAFGGVWPLGFDPDGVRMEILIEATRTGSNFDVELTVNDVSKGIMTAITLFSFKIDLFLLDRNNAHPLGDLLHWQCQSNTVPSASKPAEVLIFAEEGSGATMTSEAGDHTITCSGVENTDYQWIS